MRQTDKNGKVALVTGASSGMGKAIAEQLLTDGMTVIAAARGVDRMEDLKARGAETIALDVTDAAAMEAVVADILERHGAVDVLVNNAGFGLYGAVEDVPMDEARYQFDVNLFGAAQLTRLLLPAMRAQKAGKIVNITSMGGKIYTPLGAWYHASKHALEGWSDCLRLEVSPFGIDVIIVEPGIIRTAFAEVLLDRMVGRATSGAYEDLTAAVAESSRNAYAANRGSAPELIAGVVSRALKAPRPRTRYAAGQFARPLMWARKYLGDRLFDRIVLSTVGG